MPGTSRKTPSVADLTRVLDASLDQAPVSLGHRRTASPHEYYRYPARFSPAFVGGAIDAFTRPGDVVLDPFMGGGTTLVEARLRGRIGIGSDLNSLATFVAAAKTRVYARATLATVSRWAETTPDCLSPHLSEPPLDAWEHGGYLRGLSSHDTWRIKRLVAQALAQVEDLSGEAALLSRCIVLRTAQWALDMRTEVPTVEAFREALVANARTMVDAATAFRGEVLRVDRTHPSGGRPRSTILHTGLPGLAGTRVFDRTGPPALIVTSPPYPGVYVNYHRWKLRGRKEIKAPYWISNQLDGHGLSHYTMSARAEPTLDVYFAKLLAAYQDISRVARECTWVVTVVGFNDSESQLPRFLATLEETGLREKRFSGLATADDGRLWRDVPGRRWWAQAGTRRHAIGHTASEVVLIHTRRPSRRRDVVGVAQGLDHGKQNGSQGLAN